MSPLDIGNETQLVIDQTAVREARGIAWTLHPAKKHPENPILTADLPTDGWRVLLYGDVFYDEDECIYKMWYRGNEGQAWPRGGLRYATSEDGVHWEKPNVGTLRSDLYPVHNVVHDQAISGGVLKDPRDPDASRRYKMVTFMQGDRGYHTLVSRDGLVWERLSIEPICRADDRIDDIITAWYDERLGRYVALAKINAHVRGHRRRVFWLTTSEDFEHWTEPKLVFYPDAADDASSLARIEQVRTLLDRPDDPALMRTEFYGVTAYPAGACTVAFPWMLTINNDARYGSHEGPGEIQIAFSRDLERWQRPFRTPCVPRGKIGEWDCGWFASQSRALRVGDEVWLYYSGANHTHGAPCIKRAEGTGRGTQFTGSIGLATWELDRFASADAPQEGGTLTTPPLRFEGSRLEVNARVAEGGSLVVRPLDAVGGPIASWPASDPVHGDALRHGVTWNGRRDIGALAGRPVVLRFEMVAAELFAFQVRSDAV